MEPNKLKVKSENIIIYELESNDNFNYDALPEEAKKKIDDANEKYETEDLQKEILQKALPCQCMAPELQQRAINRSRIITDGNPFQIQLTQEDIDQKDFVLIVNEDDGIYTGIRSVLSHCKRCGELHLWGDLAPVGDMIARAFVDYDTTQERKRRREEQAKKLIETTPVPPHGGPQFMLEDTETGEMTPADDIMRAMAGMDSMPAGMSTEVIEESQMEPENEDQPTTAAGIILPSEWSD